MKTEHRVLISYVYPPSVVKSIAKAKDLISADPRQHYRINKLARLAGTNEFTLKKEFKSIYNITIYQYLLELRMQKAAWLLHTTNIKEKEIAQSCGYYNLSSFITTFKKYYHIKPGSFRNQLQLVNLPIHNLSQSIKALPLIALTI